MLIYKILYLRKLRTHLKVHWMYENFNQKFCSMNHLTSLCYLYEKQKKINLITHLFIVPIFFTQTGIVTKDLQHKPFIFLHIRNLFKLKVKR